MQKKQELIMPPSHVYGRKNQQGDEKEAFGRMVILPEMMRC